MNIQDESVFDDRARAVLPDALPAEVERRLQTQLAEFRERLHAREAGVAAAVAGAAMLYPRRAIFADAPPQDAVRALLSGP